MKDWLIENGFSKHGSYIYDKIFDKGFGIVVTLLPNNVQGVELFKGDDHLLLFDSTIKGYGNLKIEYLETLIKILG